MTAFLFIPAATDATLARRVDLANFASLFADIEMPVAARGRGPLVARLLAMMFVLLLAIGDTVLVGHPGALARVLGSPTATGVAPFTNL